MPFSDDDKDWMRMVVRGAVADGMQEHLHEKHDRLDDRIEAIQKQVWIGGGVLTAAGAFLNHLLGGHGN